MQQTQRGGALRTVAALVLLLLGLACLGLWRVLVGTESLPYSSDANPPSNVRVTSGRTYSLAVPGGARTLLAHGFPTVSNATGSTLGLQCTWSSPTLGSGALTVSPENTQTKAENTVGEFVAPVSGLLHVDCTGWGTMFVPDSDNRPTDWSGLALLLSVITLTAGGALGLSQLRLAWERTRSPWATGEDDEIQAAVDVPLGGAQDGEVGRRDRGDLGV